MEKNKNYMWSPWHGCHKISPGCLNCYVYHCDKRYEKDSSIVTKCLTNFNLPIKKNKEHQYKIPNGSTVATCFTSDFFIEDADKWRQQAWDIIKQRPDLYFFIPTKRIHRFSECIPSDWGNGYDNVIIGVTVENQAMANYRIPILLNLPIKHKTLLIAPILEKINIERYLTTKQIQEVSVGGESYSNARICDYSWVKNLQEQCIRHNVSFHFHQTGSNFIKDGIQYKIPHFKEYEQAAKAHLDTNMI